MININVMFVVQRFFQLHCVLLLQLLLLLMLLLCPLVSPLLLVLPQHLLCHQPHQPCHQPRLLCHQLHLLCHQPRHSVVSGLDQVAGMVVVALSLSFGPPARQLRLRHWQSSSLRTLHESRKSKKSSTNSLSRNKRKR